MLEKRRVSRTEKSILVVPNVETIPTWNSPTWAHLSWEKFKNEMAQFLDERLETGWKISFLSMCFNSKMNDVWAASEIVSKMQKRSTNFKMMQAPQMEICEVLDEFASHSVVISQRYHGLVLAQISETSVVSIHHHDKLKNVEPFCGEKVPYYEFAKSPLHAAVDKSTGNKPLSSLDFQELILKCRFFLQEVNDG